MPAKTGTPQRLLSSRTTLDNHILLVVPKLSISYLMEHNSLILKEEMVEDSWT